MNSLLIRNYYINDEIHDCVHQAIKKYQTKPIQDSVIEKLISTPQNILEEFKATRFSNVKGKLAEFLHAEEDNKLLAGEKRVIELDRVAFKAEFYCTIVNPDPTSRVDLLQIWKDSSTGEYHAIPLGDVKTGGVDYVLRGLDKCIRRKIPFIDTTGYTFDTIKQQKLTKGQKKKLAQLIAKVKQIELPTGKPFIIPSHVSEHEVLKSQKSLMDYYHEKILSAKYTGVKKNKYKAVYMDMIRDTNMPKIDYDWVDLSPIRGNSLSESVDENEIEEVIECPELFSEMRPATMQQFEPGGFMESVIKFFAQAPPEVTEFIGEVVGDTIDVVGKGIKSGIGKIPSRSKFNPPLTPDKEQNISEHERQEHLRRYESDRYTYKKGSVGTVKKSHVTGHQRRKKV